jgi:hypothetical protein
MLKAYSDCLDCISIIDSRQSMVIIEDHYLQYWLELIHGSCLLRLGVFVQLVYEWGGGGCLLKAVAQHLLFCEKTPRPGA